jgi:hypothetical protein
MSNAKIFPGCPVHIMEVHYVLLFLFQFGWEKGFKDPNSTKGILSSGTKHPMRKGGDLKRITLFYIRQSLQPRSDPSLPDEAVCSMGHMRARQSEH